MNVKKKICYRKLLAPLYSSNRILMNEKLKFYVIGELSGGSNPFFREKNKH